MKEDLEIEKKDGRGRTVVFVHGWLGSKESWKSVRKELELDNPMIFYSQRCHGSSKYKKFDIGDLADDLNQIIRQLEDPILVGHSMGGMTLLQYSTQSKDYSGLVLLGSSASAPKPEFGSPEFFLEKFGEIEREKWSLLIAKNYAEKGGNNLQQTAFDELMEADREPIENGLRAMKEFDVADELGKENAVVVAGENDQAIKPDQCRRLADLIECKYEVIESTHLILQEKPEKIAEIVQKFVENQ